MLKINRTLRPAHLRKKIHRLWQLSAAKIASIEKRYNVADGSPVFTARGRYTARGWTEWTQGFLRPGREKSVQLMAGHVTHAGVHDHGFNNVRTYGNLLRLMNEGRVAE